MSRKNIIKGEALRLIVQSDDMALVIRAAEIEGVQVNEFAVAALVARAENILAEHTGEKIHREDRNKFVPLADAAPRAVRDHRVTRSVRQRTPTK